LERNLQEAELVWRVDLCSCVYRTASFFADLPGSGLEDNVGSGFVEDKPENGDQGCVVDDLNVENPT